MTYAHTLTAKRTHARIYIHNYKYRKDVRSTSMRRGRLACGEEHQRKAREASMW